MYCPLLSVVRPQHRCSSSAPFLAVYGMAWLNRAASCTQYNSSFQVPHKTWGAAHAQTVDTRRSSPKLPSAWERGYGNTQSIQREHSVTTGHTYAPAPIFRMNVGQATENITTCTDSDCIRQHIPMFKDGPGSQLHGTF